MNYEQFLEIVKEKTAPLTEREFLTTTERLNEYRIRDYKRDKKELPDNKTPVYIFACSCVGGESGGSCYDNGETDSHHSFTNPSAVMELQKDFDQDFDAIVEKICPNISFLKYKTLRAIIESTEYTVNEYYGNSSIYAVLYVKLPKMYKEMKELGLFTSQQNWKCHCGETGNSTNDLAQLPPDDNLYHSTKGDNGPCGPVKLVKKGL